MGWFAAWSNSGPAANWPSYDSSGQAASKAAGILRWFARGGSHINQYNWAGGNHFGRSAGSSMVNAYYWDAPLASDNLAQGPERAHIAAAFAAVAAVAAQLLVAPAQKGLQVQLPYYASGALHAPDSQHVAYEYPGAVDAAFLENRAGGGAVLRWRGMNFSVAGGASQLALANGSVLFDSAAVAPFPSQRVWAPAPPGTLASARTWRDAALPASPAAIPPPTPPRAPWVGSALGAVVAAPAPLEAVAFSEYDSELVYYATPLAPGALAAAIAAELLAAEVPVVPPMVLNGQTLHQSAGFDFSVSPLRGGRTPELDDFEVLEWIGRFLARIHTVGAAKSFAHRPTLDVQTFALEPAEWLQTHQMIPLEVEREWREAFAAALALVQEKMAQGAADRCLIRLHGDCHPGNILWTPAELPGGGPHFVDLDDARMGPAVQDLWMLLSGDRAQRTQQLSALLDGYEQVRDFDRAELKLIEPLRTLRLIHYSAWLARRWKDPIFPVNFPWFGTPDYWRGQVLMLQEQVEQMQESPLVV
jgi:Ser/Thr protein kinase RdoA (MazF antagonist)